MVKDLQVVHEKPMHLLIVSKDLSSSTTFIPSRRPMDLIEFSTRFRTAATLSSTPTSRRLMRGKWSNALM
ncbi:MAG: hypothetical protein IPN51_14745 [Chloracidobacterium sp.]|nr:hypothetical protein [Chloracidobacterium sp.]